MTQQLALGLQLHAEMDFNNFIPGQNQQLINHLLQSLNKPEFESYYLWGLQGVGKTHLLQAICQAASQPACFIPTQFSPDILENLEQFAIICIDDIHAIAGQPHWEEALFHCYNTLRQTNALLIMTGNTSPTNLTFKLPDLKSRITWGLVFQIIELSDPEKQQALINRAQSLGLELTDTVAQYFLSHHSRNLSDLMHRLDELDKASLAEQRRLTIPFLKEHLSL